MLKEEKVFHSLNIPQWQPVIGKNGGYKVYKSRTESQVVEAATVAEAIEKSGIAAPYKIEKLTGSIRDIFAAGELEPLKKAEPEAAKPATPAAAPASAGADPAAATPPPAPPQPTPPPA